MKSLLKSLALALLSVIAVGVQAQDVASDPVSLYRPAEAVDTVAPHFMLLNEENIIPAALNKDVARVVSEAVIKVARETDVARI